MPSVRAILLAIVSLFAFVNISVSAVAFQVGENPILPRTEPCGAPGANCAATCGAGLVQCGENECQEVAAGEICCGTFVCPAEHTCGPSADSCIATGSPGPTVTTEVTTTTGTTTMTTTMTNSPSLPANVPSGYGSAPVPVTSPLLPAQDTVIPNLPNTTYAPPIVSLPVPLPESTPGNIIWTSMTETAVIPNSTVSLTTSETNIPAAATSTEVVPPTHKATQTSAEASGSAPTAAAASVYNLVGMWRATTMIGLLFAVFIVGV